MQKNFDNAIELYTVSEEELEKINSYSLTHLNEKDIFAFSVILCDNEIDRDFECFDKESLNTLAELFVGKTGILNHDMKAENQVARIYSAAVEESESEKTSTGDVYCRLRAKAYMLRNEKNQSLIDEICAGIKKEVSINCSVSEIICSECGKNVKKEHCTHIKGKDCYHILRKPTDAYEWSFVAVPAQKKAGTIKNFSVANETEEIKKYKEIAEKYNNFLRQEIIKLSVTAAPEMSAKSIDNICRSLDTDALEALRHDFIKADGCRLKPQLKKEETAISNDNFKI